MIAMSIEDILKKAFLEGWEGMEIGLEAAIAVMAITALFALYIFLIYRLMTKKSFYSPSFNVSLAGVSLITAAIVLTIQSSIVVSLGMVGALSIVRYRTAVKDPIDLMFLFWSISVGIICGAGLAEIAVVLSLVLTVAVLLLEHLPAGKAPMILVVNSSSMDAEEEVLEVVKEYCRHPKVKSRNMTAQSLDLTIELRTKEGAELLRKVMEVDSVGYASLLSHDGEVTF